VPDGGDDLAAEVVDVRQMPILTVQVVEQLGNCGRVDAGLLVFDAGFLVFGREPRSTVLM
jgi:hypothetical protein